MKRISLISILVLISFYEAISQAVVYDPTLHAEVMISESASQADRAEMKVTSSKQLAEAVSQTNALSQTVDYMKQAHEAVSVVNSHLTSINKTQRALDRQKSLLKRTQTLINNAGQDDHFTLDEYVKIQKSLMRNIDQCLDIMDMFGLVLSAQTKMNDGDRMKLVMEIDKDLAGKHAAHNSQLRYYENLYQERKAIAELNEMGIKLNP